jgi:PEGA domain
VPAPAPVGTPLVATSNPLRKQTLLGMAPAASESPPSPPSEDAVDAPREALVVPATTDNPLRKQTLLGIAPEPADASAESDDAPPTDSVASLMAPPVVATDAPTTLEVEPSAAAAPVISWPPPQPPALGTEAEDEPDLKPKRARFLLPLGIAAALGLGVIGVQQLARAPAPLPPPAAVQAPPVAPQPTDAKQSSDDHGGLGAATTESAPAEAAPSVDPVPSAAPAASATPSGDVVRIRVNSDPPGARLFWKGKPIGTTPFVLELAPGEKHAYEMGLPGYNARKVVIDGSKTELRIGLKPEAGTFIGGARRKP